MQSPRCRQWYPARVSTWQAAVAAATTVAIAGATPPPNGRRPVLGRRTVRSLLVSFSPRIRCRVSCRMRKAYPGILIRTQPLSHTSSMYKNPKGHRIWRCRKGGARTCWKCRHRPLNYAHTGIAWNRLRKRPYPRRHRTCGSVCVLLPRSRQQHRHRHRRRSRHRHHSSRCCKIAWGRRDGNSGGPMSGAPRIRSTP